MTRLSVENAAVANSVHFPYALLGYFDFAEGAVCANTSDRDYDFDGNTYRGLSEIVSISDIEENSDGTPAGLVFGLNGVDPTLTEYVLAQDYHRRDVRLYLAFLTEQLQFAHTPYLLWEGYMDTMSTKSGRNTDTISLSAENRLIMFNRAKDWQYTDAHQRLFDSTDQIFDQVNGLANKVVMWKDFVVAQQEFRQERGRQIRSGQLTRSGQPRANVPRTNRAGQPIGSSSSGSTRQARPKS